MLARLRSLPLKTPVLITIGLFVAWLLFGWFGFGPLSQWAAERYVADKTGHHLTMDEPKFDPLGLELTLAHVRLTEPDGKFLAGFKELFVDFEASSLFRWAWTFDTIRLVQPEGNLALLPGAKLNWSPFLAAFKSPEPKEKTEKANGSLPRLLIHHFQLSGGQLDFADRTVQPPFNMVFKPLELSLDDLSTLPDDKGAYQIAARTVLGARLRWKGDLQLKPVAVTGAFSLEGIQLAQLAPYLKGRVNVGPPAGQLAFDTNYRLTYDRKQLGLTLDRLGLVLTGLRLRGLKETEPALSIDRFAVRDGRFDLASHTLELGTVSLDGGQANLARRLDGSLNLQDWLPASPAGTPAPPPAAKSPPGTSWHVTVGKFDLNKVAVHYADQSFRAPLDADLADVHLGFKADARIGGGKTEASLSDGSITGGKITVSSGSTPILELDGIRVEGAMADLCQRKAEVSLAALEKGTLNVERARDGSVPLLTAFKSAATRHAEPTVSPNAVKQPGWSWTLAQARLDDFQVIAHDNSVKPPAGLTLEHIDASVDGLSQDLSKAVPVKLGLQVKEGGRFDLTGQLTPAKGELDARLVLAGLNLTPAQPYLAQAANLTLVSGRAGSHGRLRIGRRTQYAGSFGIANLLVRESRTHDRFLAWRNLSTGDLKVTPDALNIGQLNADGLGAKLVIHKDKSTNLQAVLKQKPSAQAGARTAREPSRPTNKTGFRLAIDRIKVTGGEMDFADESLALPFGTRIHGLKGYVDGIDTRAEAPAQIQLDGLVDDYGLARADGQIDFMNPTANTDVKVVFRNVEMTRLTPYSATFAGRKIASGKLSLDLDYKIKDRQLAGDNKIVMDRLTLGERVESPTAKNLPLDLAIAILQDSDGRIDLGLPVSGSLDDPHFSYGAIIWKAIVNLIGKIALAPFRALGSLFGGSGEKMEHVLFDAGRPDLLPPEKEKLKKVAQVLAKRPRLALTVQGGWNPEADGLAIRQRHLHRALAEAMGRKLGPDEDAGPLSIAQAKTREALEKLYATRFGPKALKDIQAKYAQANPGPPPTTTAGRLLSKLSGLFKEKPRPLSPEETARLKGADLYELLYRSLLDREQVTAPELAGLGKARGEAILSELAADGVPADRLAGKPPAALSGEAGKEIPIKLELGVAAQPASMPAAQPAH